MRQRAVDLLYAMCDRSNAEEIVSEMLTYLETADYSIREEMVSECPLETHSASKCTTSEALFLTYMYAMLWLCTVTVAVYL